MIDASYQREIEGMRQMLAQFTAKTANSSDLKRRTIVSASLYNLLPSIPQSEYPRILDSLALYQEWSVRDQVHLHLIDSLQVEGRVPAPTDQPGIFCSYHLGSYRLLIPYLISKKLKFTFLIDSDVANLQRKNFEEVIRRSAQRFGADADCCHIIDTAKAGVMFTMLKELKRGRSLVAFIDGNSGVDSTRAGSDNKVDVDFCGHVLEARKGMAYLSHMAKVPLLPVVLTRGTHDVWTNTISFQPSLEPGANEPRDEHAARAMQYLYRVLENALRTHYEQWESWSYVEQSLSLSSQEPAPVQLQQGSYEHRGVTFNDERYSLTQPDTNEYLLFDRKYYRSTFISEAFMNFLRLFLGARVAFAESVQLPQSSPGLIHKLLSNGALHVTD